MMFAFSTILGWSYYGERAVEYLFGIRGILPYKVFATSSIDALVHAAESYLSPKATPPASDRNDTAAVSFLHFFQKRLCHLICRFSLSVFLLNRK